MEESLVAGLDFFFLSRYSRFHLVCCQAPKSMDSINRYIMDLFFKWIYLCSHEFVNPPEWSHMRCMVNCRSDDDSPHEMRSLVDQCHSWLTLLLFPDGHKSFCYNGI